MSRTREYATWENMKQRCNNVNHKSYKDYGGRGIKYCKRWEKFENFYKDMGRKPEGMTLDRIDNEKGYKPSNCKWSTYSEQNRNKRGHTNTGEKYISYLKKQGFYQIRVRPFNPKTTKCFKEAKKIRNEFLIKRSEQCT